MDLNYAFLPVEDNPPPLPPPPNNSTSAANAPHEAQRYQYQPLDETRREIRLMLLLPGNFSDPIHVELGIFPFPDDNDLIPDFEALSYCWGSKENPQDIFIGESDTDRLSVTKNLAEALPYLRHPEWIRVLWIDAICVNQMDLKERGHQVRRMADIYSNASRVIVWLGPKSHDSDMAMDRIEEISSHIEVDFERYNMRSIDDEVDWADREVPPPFEEHDFLALSSFLNREWFERLWIVQEVHLARKVIVYCGERELSWSSLRKSVFCLYRKPKSSKTHCKNAYGLCRRVSKDFIKLLDRTKRCKCLDSRDRVFALLSLTRHSFEHELEPSYTKDVFEVYEEAMLRWSQVTHRLDLLTMVETQEQLEYVPSWVPDWSTRRTTNRFKLGLAGGLSTLR